MATARSASSIWLRLPFFTGEEVEWDEPSRGLRKSKDRNLLLCVADCVSWYRGFADHN